MAGKKKFSLEEKKDILEQIKELWENSEDITYKQLEEIQKQKWKQVVYKSGTLRNKASKEEWNRNKGKAVEERQLEKVKETIQSIDPEIIEADHSSIIKGLESKYRSEFDKARKILNDAIDEEDMQRVRFSNEVFKAISRARKVDLELMGTLDVADQRKIELEVLKMELLNLEKTNKINNP